MKRKASDDICFGEVNIMKYWNIKDAAVGSTL